MTDVAPISSREPAPAASGRAARLPNRQLSLTDFGKLDLPVSGDDADLPAPKYSDADLPSPKRPPGAASEAGSGDPDEFLPSPLRRPSRLSMDASRPSLASSPAIASPPASAPPGELIDPSAKPTMQTLSGGFLAPGVVRSLLPMTDVPPQPGARPRRRDDDEPRGTGTNPDLRSNVTASGKAGPSPRATALPKSSPGARRNVDSNPSLDAGPGHGATASTTAPHRELAGSEPALVLASAAAPRPVLLPATFAARDSDPPFAPKRGRRALVAALAALAIGGLAVALTPLGAPVRKAFEGAGVAGRASRQGSTERALREAFITDRADASGLALSGAEAAWVQAGRGPEATPTLVYAGSLYGLRFGLEAGLAARVQAAFERLPGGNRKDDALARAAYDAASGRDLARAKGALRSMLATEAGSDVDALALAGEAFLAAGDAAPAVEFWSSLARLETSPRAHYGLARALASIDRRAEADDHARQTLALARDHAGARVILAQSAWRAGRHDDVALPYVQEATQNPQVRAGAGAAELVEAYALLADIHEARGRVGASERAWADALRVDGRSPRALLGAGEMLYQMGRYAEAIERFEAARAVDPRRAEAGLGTAKAKLALGRPREAQELLRAVARESEERGKASAQLWTWLGRAELALGSDGAAEVAFRRAISLGVEGADVADAHAALAEIQEKRGQLRPALAAWRHAIELDPQRPEWHYRLGRLFARVGRHDDARTHLYAAVQPALAREPPPPWTSDACLLLAKAERKAGHLSSATAHYRCALAKP